MVDKPTRPTTTIENGFFQMGTDYYRALGTDAKGDTVKGFGKTREEAEADYYDKIFED